MLDAESDSSDEDINQQYEKENNTEPKNDGMQEIDFQMSDSGDEVKDDDDNAAKKVDPPPAKPKGTRKLIVLNTARLKGRKGIHTIEKLYEGFKFNGKGHEKDDLDRVMKRLEYWAFRLFPKLSFDDFLSKLEHLGHKKDLQVHLKKYRLGMITADDDMSAQNDIIEDEEREENSAIIRTENEMLAQISDNEFQRLFDETHLPAEPIL